MNQAVSDKYREIFSSMDIKRTESVKKWIPFVPGKGTHGKIPTSILGCSKNPLDVIAKAEEFRNMEPEEQAKLAHEWRHMSGKFQRPYQDNLKYLIALRTRLLLQKVSWEDIAKPCKIKETLDSESGSSGRKRGVSSVPHDEERQEPAKHSCIDNESSGDSTGQERRKETDKPSIEMACDSSPSKKKMRTENDDKAMRAQHLAHSLANQKFYGALEHVATYSDSIQMSERGQEGQPLRACFFVDVNYLEESSDGGLVELDKPNITVVGKNKEDAFHVLGTFAAAIKHFGNSESEQLAESIAFLESKEDVDSFLEDADSFLAKQQSKVEQLYN